MDSSGTDGDRMSQYGCAVAINTLSLAICSAHLSSVKLFLVLEQIRPYHDRILEILRTSNFFASPSLITLRIALKRFFFVFSREYNESVFLKFA